MRPITINIPDGKLSNTTEEAAAKKRREIREKLLRGEEIKVTPSGTVTDKNESRSSNEPSIVVPPGKLAASFYWYENDAALYRAEIESMRRYFPQFKLEKLDDNRLSWYGTLISDLNVEAVWHLQIVYDNNHPNNSTYGGSVKVYSIMPDLQKVCNERGNIPHILHDSAGQLYLCTSRREDFRASQSHSTTAASALGWAAKWIAAFELWVAGDITTAEFSGHNI
jgi:hypothetical protein